MRSQLDALPTVKLRVESEKKWKFNWRLRRRQWKKTKRSKTHCNKSRQLRESAVKVSNMVESPGRFDVDATAGDSNDKERIKAGAGRGRNEMDRGNDKAAVKFLLITMMTKGATTLLKCFEKCQQRIYKMALMPQRSRCRFCARDDFFNDGNRGGKCAWRALEMLMEMQTQTGMNYEDEKSSN